MKKEIDEMTPEDFKMSLKKIEMKHSPTSLN